MIYANLKVKNYRYWAPKCNIDDGMSIEDAIEGSRHHLIESLKIRLRSDVPHGLLKRWRRFSIIGIHCSKSL